MVFFRIMGSSILVASAIMMSTNPSQAQLQSDGATSNTPDNSPESGEITVTARRREESLSKVPLAVSALSSDVIVKQGIRNEQDLQTSVPGFLARQVGNSTELNLSIRGQSIDSFSSSPSAVLPYVNEFQVSTMGGNALFDLEGIQVLKGPQGTLFGRNTTGGAVLYATKKPGNNFEGYVTARYGNFGAIGVEGAVTLPLVEDRLSIRIAANYSDGGGFTKNLGYYLKDPSSFYPAGFTFVPKNETLGSIRDRTVRATIWARPADTIENSMMVQYGIDDGTVKPSLIYSIARGSPANSAAYAISVFDTVAPADGPFAGPDALTRDVAWQRTTNRETYSGPSNQLFSRSFLATNTTKIELSDNLTLKNIVGWNFKDRYYVVAYDGSVFGFYRNMEFYGDPNFPGDRGAQHGRDAIFSEEIQLQGKAFANKLDFILGLYYLNNRHLEDNHLEFYQSPIFPYRLGMRDRAYAAFAQGSYAIAQNLNVTAGLRYSQEKIDAHQLPGGNFSPPSYGNFPAAIASTFLQDQAISFQNPSWNISVDYQVTPSLLLYVAQRGSWRAGGFNFPALPRNYDGTGLVTAGNPLGLTGNIFQPEKARDIEAGLKFNGLIGGKRVTITADFYNQWVNGVQRTANVLAAPNTPGVVTVNVPQAVITGQELGMTIQLTPSLSAGGQITHATPRYTDGNVYAAGALHPYTQYADMPHWSGAAYFEFNYPVSGSSSVTLRGDVYAQSKFDFANYKPGDGGGDTVIPGYALVNGRLSWNNIQDSRVSLAIFAKNLFDVKYYAGGLSAETAFGINTVSAGTPRTYGAEATVKF